MSSFVTIFDGVNQIYFHLQFYNEMINPHDPALHCNIVANSVFCFHFFDGETSSGKNYILRV